MVISACDVDNAASRGGCLQGRKSVQRLYRYTDATNWDRYMPNSYAGAMKDNKDLMVRSNANCRKDSTFA